MTHEGEASPNGARVERGAPIGHVKATREDWLNAARDLLISDGLKGLKVLVLAEHLDVSRSSFYWYFKSRKELLAALLDDWETRNTQTLREHCERDAPTITAAVCNFFRCFIDPRQFDQGLDFAVRAWARQDETVRALIDEADALRLSVIEKMYVRFGYSTEDADIRARILYFQQLGYHALDISEPLEIRLNRLEGYLHGFTGKFARAEETQELLDFAFEVMT